MFLLSVIIKTKKSWTIWYVLPLSSNYFIIYRFTLELLLDIAVTLLEAVNTTCCINELRLTSVEWV